VSVKLIHDVQAAAIGEALYGAARGRDRFVYFIWGTGIGAGDIKKIDDHRYFMFSFKTATTSWNGGKTVQLRTARLPGSLPGRGYAARVFRQGYA
jgi:hypothetical protein